MAKSMINDLTVGSVPGKLIRFSIPFILANFLQFLYNIVDMIIVGQFVGSAGLSAVSIGGEFMHFFTFIAVGFAQAGQVLIAQSIGRGTRGEGLSRIIGNLFTFILGLSLVVTAVSVLFPQQFAQLMNTPPESFSEAVSYCTVCGAGMFFVFGYNTVSHVMQGMGDSRHPLIFVAVSAGLNLILDLLFVGVFHLRATGAALATVIGQSFSFVVSMVFLYRRRESFGFDFRLRSCRLRTETGNPYHAPEHCHQYFRHVCEFLYQCLRGNLFGCKRCGEQDLPALQHRHCIPPGCRFYHDRSELRGQPQ